MADVWWTLKSSLSGWELKFAPRQHRLKCMLRFCQFVCQLSLKCLVSIFEQIYTHAQASRHFDAALAPPAVALCVFQYY